MFLEDKLKRNKPQKWASTYVLDTNQAFVNEICDRNIEYIRYYVPETDQRIFFTFFSSSALNYDLVNSN